MKLICPKCNRLPYSFAHFNRCQIRKALHCPNKCGATFYYGVGELPNVLRDMRQHTNQLCTTLKQNKPHDELLYYIHRQEQSLSYFTYNLLKEHGLLDKYTTWQRWAYDLFLNINWNKDWWIYIAWQNATRDTCMNIPCNECRQKEIDRATRHSFMKKQLHIQRAKNKAIDERQRVIAQ